MEKKEWNLTVVSNIFVGAALTLFVVGAVGFMATESVLFGFGATWVLIIALDAAK